jgi:hypothetical protein
MVEFDEYIKGGTSGSPIINAEGEIVAVVSLAGGPVALDFDPSKELGDASPFTGKGCSGASPRPATALPVWAVRHMTEAEEDEERDDLLAWEISKKI